MADDTRLYPAVRCTIAGRPKRFHLENDLKKAIRLGDIRPASEIVYEPDAGHEQVMAARDCPLLEGLFTDAADGGEPHAPGAAGSPSPAAPAASASPWAAQAEDLPALDYRDVAQSGRDADVLPASVPVTGPVIGPVIEREKPRGGCFKRAFIVLFLLIGAVYILGKFSNGAGGSAAANVCPAGSGEVTRAEASEAGRYYIDRVTNIRSAPAVSGKKLGRAARGQGFDMRRAAGDSNANWYQITAGEFCGRYIYSYAAEPLSSRPETLVQSIGGKKRILRDTALLEKPGGRAIGSVPAGALVTLVGYTADGFAEIIAPGQDNLLGYTDRSAFDTPPPSAPPEAAGLTIFNNCPFPVRSYTGYNWRGQPWGTWSRLPPGRSLTISQDGEKVVPSDSGVRFYAEADQPAYSDAELNAWRPPAPLADLSLNPEGNYLLTPNCNLTPQ